MEGIGYPCTLLAREQRLSGDICHVQSTYIYCMSYGVAAVHISSVILADSYQSEVFVDLNALSRDHMQFVLGSTQNVAFVCYVEHSCLLS